MASRERSRQSRLAVEHALVHFALLAGDHAHDFVVIGGLNPDFLAPLAPVPHLGTTDVDLLFELGFIYDRDERDFGWLDRILAGREFKQRSTVGWQWYAILADSMVRIDLLCDEIDSPGQSLTLPGASTAAAQNLAGPGAALFEPIERQLKVPSALQALHPGAHEIVTLRFATLGGYVIAKAGALLTREADKDAYDLGFVLLFNEGGPAEAARQAAQIEMPAPRFSHRPGTARAIEQLADAAGRAAGAYAEAMILAGDSSRETQLRAEVAAGAQCFLDEFARLTP